jgi:hypothetical protein
MAAASVAAALMAWERGKARLPDHDPFAKQPDGVFGSEPSGNGQAEPAGTRAPSSAPATTF